MLKKLFISLLILTTLSSEGIINFPANVYNFYMSPGSESDLLADKNLTSGELQSAKKCDSLRLSSLLDVGFSLTSNSLQKFKFKNIPVDFNKEDNIHYFSSITIKCKSVYFAVNRYSILQMSDNSPPSVII